MRRWLLLQSLITYTKSNEDRLNGSKYEMRGHIAEQTQHVHFTSVTSNFNFREGKPAKITYINRIYSYIKVVIVSVKTLPHDKV